MKLLKILTGTKYLNKTELFEFQELNRTVNMEYWKAGIIAGDRVKSIDGEKINTWEELANLVRRSGGKKLNLLIERDEGDTGQVKEVKIQISPVQEDKELGKKMISNLVIRLYTVGRMLNPVMPETNVKIKTLIKENKSPEKPLFPRKD